MVFPPACGHLKQRSRVGRSTSRRCHAVILLTCLRLFHRHVANPPPPLRQDQSCCLPSPGSRHCSCLSSPTSPPPTPSCSRPLPHHHPFSSYAAARLSLHTAICKRPSSLSRARHPPLLRRRPQVRQEAACVCCTLQEGISLPLSEFPTSPPPSVPICLLFPNEYSSFQPSVSPTYRPVYSPRRRAERAPSFSPRSRRRRLDGHR